MKFLTTISKNLKLLFRSKESAYTIVFGPLLIILIVSFAFMGASDDFTVRVGFFTEEHTSLSDRTVSTLNEKNYLVSVYPDNESCIDSVKEGNNHACMVFISGQSRDETIPVTFHLDLSRINIVYQIIDDLSETLDIQADKIREQLASNTEVRMQSAATIVEENSVKADAVASKFAEIIAELSLAESAVGAIPESPDNMTDLSVLKGYQLGLGQNTQFVSEHALEALDEAKMIIRELERRCLDCPEGVENDVDRVQEIIDKAERDIIITAESTAPKQLEEAQLILRFAIDDLEGIQETINNATRASTTVKDGVAIASSGFSEGQREVQQIASRLKYTGELLRGQRADPSVVSSPISTSIVSITVSDDTLSFAYPYLLVLVIMFIGMLLGSMLVVTDKTSQAAFRNFTTPTSDGYHMMLSFFTAFLILIVEMVIILLASGFFVAQPLLLNPFSTILIVSVAIVIFTFLGMIVGYLSRTQEAAMISSISIGSVLLFVSNLIIPLEGMTGFTQFLGAFNPYIVLSELLKKSMLYGVTAGQIAKQMFTLAIFITVLVIITVIVQRYIKKKYFAQEDPILPVIHHIPNPLYLGERSVHNEIELMDALDRMTRSDFEKIVAKGHIVAEWVERELRNKRLARQLKTKNKERMMLRLDKHLKRHGKNIKR